MKNWNLKKKLLVSFLAVGIIPVIVGAIYSYNKSATALKNEAEHKLHTIRVLKKKNLEGFIQTLKDQIITLSRQESTKDAMTKFALGTKNYVVDHGYEQNSLENGRSKIQNYFKEEFNKEFKKRNGSETDLTQLFKMSSSQIALQMAFIINNPNALGSKHLLNAPDDLGLYNKTHTIYHPNFREYLERFSLYDVFLVDSENGNIVYSVFKEIDFGTSLMDGPYASSGLGKAFKEANALKDPNAVVVTDYQAYLPSFNFPAMFLAVPIWVDGTKKGVLAFQLNLDRINTIMNERVGSERTLDVYLVGADKLMRTDSSLDKTHHSVEASFRHPDRGSIKLASIDEALKGGEGETTGKDILGNESLVSYGPFDFLGIRWGMVATYDLEEAFAPIYEMRLASLLLIFISIVAITLFVVYFSNGLSKTLFGISSEIAKTAQEASSSSTELTSASSSLSQGATESAASLEETVASLEELSSMVKLNADHANEANKLSQSSLEFAGNGEKEILTLIAAMSELSKSSSRIQEIISVIDEIAFQTNLLALNAAVEAARAGEQGKGFAVVADAVRNLAQRSADAAKEIAGLIKENVEKTEAGVTVADTSGEALKKIVEGVKKVASLNSEISSASKEQANGIEQISKAMNQLDQAIQTNAASSEEVASAAEEMSAQAKVLASSAEHLRVFVVG